MEERTMNNERPKVTMDIPVDFNFDYTEDGKINIVIDTDVLEKRIAKAVIDSLQEYIAANTKVKCKGAEAEVEEEPKVTESVMVNVKEDTWFKNTMVAVSNDGLLKLIKFPNNLSINFVYDEEGNIVRVVNQGQICDIEAIGNYILRYDVR
jgi:hypothetical protein